MEIIFENLEKTVNSPTGYGSFKIEVDGKNVTKVGNFEFIGAYALTDINDIISAIIKLKKGEEDEVNVNLNGSVFEMNFIRLTEESLRISTSIQRKEEDFTGKKSNEGEVKLDEFCRELVETVEEMDKLRKPPEDGKPQRWKGLGETIKSKKESLKSLLEE